MKITPTPIEEDKAKIEKLRQSYYEILKQSKMKWRENDARRWLLSRLATILFISTLHLYIESEYLSDISFWKKYLAAGDPNQIAKEGFRYFDRHARASLVIETVAALEHSYNIILNAANLAPKTNNFYNLFTEVIKLTHEEDDYKNAKKPFKLLRLIRNCHHNSWIHQPDSCHDSNVTIKYKDVDYYFEDNQMPLFISWELLHDVLQDILTINTSLINHPSILKIEYIKDLGAMETMRE